MATHPSIEVIVKGSYGMGVGKAATTIRFSGLSERKSLS